MKNAVLLLTLLGWGCAPSVNQDAEQAVITELLHNETHYALTGDSANWASCWATGEEVSLRFTDATGTSEYHGWSSVASLVSDFEPVELTLERDNYHYVIGNDVAFVSFDQRDNWGESGERRTKETRSLRKIDGQWKIITVDVVDISSLETPTTESFHVFPNEIPQNPKTGFANLSGLGGMSIGYIDVPTTTDFTPLFAGLPQDMCNSPHWGYVLDGAIRLKYANGKEETVEAEEVFYWPAPHTAMVDDHVKLLDFSPDREFVPLMDHIALKMDEMASNE